jgi:hypothetical protein
MKSNRVPLGKKLRFEVFKRDGFTCVYCGGQPPKVVLHCDHVVAVANGGTNDIDNLVTACDACNLGKGARELTAVPLSIEEKTAILREREDQIAAFNDLISEKLARIELTAWAVADVFIDSWRDDGIRRDWFASIERFADRLSLDDLLMAANRAVTKQPRNKSAAFSYFCGICWKLIKDGDQR